MLKVAVLDTETTGLNPDVHEMIQIGILVYNGFGGDLIEEVNYKIQPQNIESASAEALAVNGYTEEGWEGGSMLEDIIEDIRLTLNTADVLIGHNLIFDINFVNKAFEDTSMDPPRWAPYYDTKAMAKALHGSNSWQSSLDRLCESYNVNFEGRAHTAIVDCERTMTIWLKLVDDAKTDGRMGLIKLYTSEKPYDPFGRKRGARL